MTKKLAYPVTPSPDKEQMYRTSINAEYVLDEVALKEFREVDLSNIRPDTAQVDEARRDHYAVMMEEEKALFPPIVGVRNSNGEIELLGGAHRYAAAEQIGATHIPAYVFPLLTDRQALDVRVLDNRGHGMELKKSEKLKLADQLIDVNGYSIPEAAHRVGLGDHVVRRQRKIAESQRRAREQGGLTKRQVGTVSQSTLVELNKIRNKAAYEAATKLATDKGMKARDVADLVEAVETQHNEPQMLELLRREAEARYEIETTRRDQYSKLAGALTQLENVDFDAARAQAHEDEIPVLVERIRGGLGRLNAWLDDLAPAGKK